MSRALNNTVSGFIVILRSQHSHLNMNWIYVFHFVLFSWPPPPLFHSVFSTTSLNVVKREWTACMEISFHRTHFNFLRKQWNSLHRTNSRLTKQFRSFRKYDKTKNNKKKKRNQHRQTERKWYDCRLSVAGCHFRFSTKKPEEMSRVPFGCSTFNRRNCSFRFPLLSVFPRQFDWSTHWQIYGALVPARQPDRPPYAHTANIIREARTERTECSCQWMRSFSAINLIICISLVCDRCSPGD